MQITQYSTWPQPPPQPSLHTAPIRSQIKVPGLETGTLWQEFCPHCHSIAKQNTLGTVVCGCYAFFVVMLWWIMYFCICVSRDISLSIHPLVFFQIHPLYGALTTDHHLHIFAGTPSRQDLANFKKTLPQRCVLPQWLWKALKHTWWRFQDLVRVAKGYISRNFPW